MPIHSAPAWRHKFVLAWSMVTLIKVVIAWRLPLFVDEAFYWQEGQYLAWAYSDLPGLTAWLIRLGVEVGGHHVLAVRMPFLLMGALLPWLVAAIAARWFDEKTGWQAGLLTALMPLSATLGILALPDVPMALATAICIDAGARLLRTVTAGGALELALGLSIGALCHYRFVGVIAVGFIALLLMQEGRKILRDPRVIVALAIGAAAWMPLIMWNADNADVGLRFQLFDRHPWTFHVSGLNFIVIQAVLVTPLLFIALARTFMSALRSESSSAQWRYFGLLGGVSTLGFFILGFFSDTDRVSFHWTLPGYLALLAVAPTVLRQWGRLWRRLTWACLIAGTLAVLGWHIAIATPSIRAGMAGHKAYPHNFGGWDEIADAVSEELAAMPADTELVAGNFKLGAELGFKLGRSDVRVLPHPLNEKHGRAPQLELWGLTHSDPVLEEGENVLLVISSKDVRYRELLAHYHELCEMVGPLVPARIINADHGAQRFILVKLQVKRDAPCTTPAMGYVDAPASGATVGRRFTVSGWAFRDGVGIDKVEILLDGQPVAVAEYGLAMPEVQSYWHISTDSSQPNIGYRAEVDASRLPAGRHWLGLRLHGADGVIEDWSEQPVTIKD